VSIEKEHMPLLIPLDAPQTAQGAGRCTLSEGTSHLCPNFVAIVAPPNARARACLEGWLVSVDEELVPLSVLVEAPQTI